MAASQKTSDNPTDARKTKQDGWRIPARQLDEPVLEAINRLLSDPLKLSEAIKLDSLSIHQQELVFEQARQLAEKLNKNGNQQIQKTLKRIVQKVVIEPTNIKVGIDVLALTSLLNCNPEDSVAKTTDGKNSNDVDSEVDR